SEDDVSGRLPRQLTRSTPKGRSTTAAIRKTPSSSSSRTVSDDGNASAFRLSRKPTAAYVVAASPRDASSMAFEDVWTGRLDTEKESPLRSNATSMERLCLSHATWVRCALGGTQEPG